MTTQQTRLPQRLKTSFRALCRRPRRTLACSKIPSVSKPATRPVKRDHQLMRAEQQEVYKVICHPVAGSSDRADQTAKSSSIVALMLIFELELCRGNVPWRFGARDYQRTRRHGSHVDCLCQRGHQWRQWQSRSSLTQSLSPLSLA